MSKSNYLDRAKNLMKCRKFSLAIQVLENRSDFYEDEFESCLTLGICYLYTGVYGQAHTYFNKCRAHSVQDVNLLLGQSVIFLIRLQLDRAISYYLEVLDLDPNNETAKFALDFIRQHGDHTFQTTISKMMDSGEIEKLFPPLGINPISVKKTVFSGLALGIIISIFLVNIPKLKTYYSSTVREDSFSLTKEELKKPLKDDVSDQVIAEALSPKEVIASYNDAKKFFSLERDNACQVEINRLMRSGAEVSIKNKASEIQKLLHEPSFNTLKDNYDYSVVCKDIYLFENCYVDWAGRISNERIDENGRWSCNFLIGYENLKSVIGDVPVVFESRPQPAVNPSKPVRFLAKITVVDNNIVLEGRAVHQALGD